MPRNGIGIHENTDLYSVAQHMYRRVLKRLEVVLLQPVHEELVGSLEDQDVPLQGQEPGLVKPGFKGLLIYLLPDSLQDLLPHTRHVLSRRRACPGGTVQRCPGGGLERGFLPASRERISDQEQTST